MKVYLCVDGDGSERLSITKDLQRQDGLNYWFTLQGYTMVDLPKGTIEAELGKKLTWEDEPTEVHMTVIVPKK